MDMDIVYIREPSDVKPEVLLTSTHYCIARNSVCDFTGIATLMFPTPDIKEGTDPSQR